MNKQTIKLRIAKNINQLSDDGITVIDGRVTGNDIDNRINDIYTEVLFPLLSDKYKEQLEQTLYPRPTYTQTSTVSASTTGTTLIINDAVFDNTMETFEIENPTRNSKIAISTFVSTTQVTMASSVTAAGWQTGDTIYVLGNIFALNDIEDLKEFTYLGIKYTTADTKFRPATRVDREKVFQTGYESFNFSTPEFFETSVDIDGINYPAIGFLPVPSSYLGKWEARYTEKPQGLNANDIIRFSNAGLSEAIINGVTAWALRLKGEAQEANEYEEIDPKTRLILPKGTRQMLLTYRPKSRVGSLKFKTPTKFKSMRMKRS